MSEGARLQPGAGGELQLQGALRFGTVTALLEALPLRGAEVVIDLGELEAVDSAGLALLVEWQRRARSAGVALRLRRAPAQLLRLAELGGVDRLLGLYDAERGS